MIDYYPELNISCLERSARKWAIRHPCIEKISLFFSVADDLRYIFFVVAPEFTQTKLPEDEDTWTEDDIKNDRLMEYYNWSDEACAHIAGDIPTFYKNPDLADQYHWMWFPVNPDESTDLGGFNEGSPFVDLKSEYVLYRRENEIIRSPKASNDDNSFPHLIESELKRHASRWATRDFSDVPIQQVSLHHFSSRFQRYYNFKVTGKYCIVFHVNDTDPTAGLSGEAALKYSLQTANRKRPEQAWQELNAAIESWDQSDPGNRYYRILTSSFSNVYMQQPPPDNWRSEWLCYVNLNNSTLSDSVLTDEPGWVFFENNLKSEGFPSSTEESFDEYLARIYPDLVLFYKTLKDYSLQGMLSVYEELKAGSRIPNIQKKHIDSFSIAIQVGHERQCILGELSRIIAIDKRVEWGMLEDVKSYKRMYYRLKRNEK